MEKKEKKEKMGVLRSMVYTIQTIWKADKGCVLISFYKNCSEEIFASFFFIYLLQILYAYIEGNEPYGKLAKFIIIFCSLHVCIHIASAIYAYYIRLRTPKVYAHVFNRVIDKASTIALTKYEEPEFYDRFSKALDECLTKAMDGLRMLTWAIGCFLSAIAAMYLIARVDPILLLFSIPPVAVSFWCGTKINHHQYRLRDEETRDKRVSEYVKRVFYEKKYASEIRLYGIRNLLFGKYEESYENRYQINKKAYRKITFYQILEGGIMLGLNILVTYLYVAIILKNSGEAKIGAYIAMLSGIEYFSWRIRTTVKNFIEAGRCCIYMNNLQDFLEMKDLETETGTELVSGELGDIHFNHVTFTYKGAKDPVIKDLSLSIKKGERIALVGENGAGKTTLIKLLMGLYPVSEGQILIDGKNIEKYQKEDYHYHFGTVFQDLQIFALPISHNVLMKEPENEAERQIVVEALLKAQFGDKLEELPNGIDTIVTKEFDEHGFICSGGQAQKIAIARVFAKNPDIVILDEPSSALDPIAEYNMYNNMMHASKGKTVFFISHRLSSARIADRIFFLEQGQIVETGTHDELMEKNGKYASMFLLQAKNYKETMLRDLQQELSQGGEGQ